MIWSVKPDLLCERANHTSRRLKSWIRPIMHCALLSGGILGDILMRSKHRYRADIRKSHENNQRYSRSFRTHSHAVGRGLSRSFQTSSRPARNIHELPRWRGRDSVPIRYGSGSRMALAKGKERRGCPRGYFSRPSTPILGRIGLL